MITELERRLMDAFHEDAQRARLVHPDPSSEHHEGRSDLQLDAIRLESDARLVPVNEIVVSLDSPTSGTRNRRRLAMAGAAVVAGAWGTGPGRCGAVLIAGSVRAPAA